MKENRPIDWGMALLTGLMTAAGSGLFTPEGMPGLLLQLLCGAAAAFLWLLARPADAECRKAGFAFGTFLAAAMVIGRPVYTSHDIALLWASAGELALTLCALLGFRWAFGSAAAVVYHVIRARSFRRAYRPGYALAGKRWLYPALTALLLLSWIPAVVTFWPGLENYDIFNQYFEFAAGGSTSHPMLHTSFAGLCDWLGSVTGVYRTIYYSAIQMTLLALMLARIPYRMIRASAPRWLIIVSLLFLTVNPVMQMAALSTTKDVFVGIFMIGTVLSLTDLLTDPEGFVHSPWRMLGLWLNLLLCCLNRHNVILACLALPLLLIPLKKYLKPVGAVLLAAILCFFAVDKLLWPALTVGRASAVEPWSVPLHQAGAVVQRYPGELDDWEKDQVTRFMTWDIMNVEFNPRFSDPMKEKAYIGEQDWKTDLMSFLRLWAKLGIRHPVDYATVLVDLNSPYWYPLAATNDPYSKRDYIELNLWKPDKDNILDRYYTDAAGYTLFENIPVLGEIFSIHFPIWLMLFAVYAARAYGMRKYNAMLMFPLAYVVSFLLGPVSNFRYVIPAFVLYPFFLWVIADPAGFGKKPMAND